MRIKIISDGSGANTRIVDAETGEKIWGVRSVEWKIRGPKNIAECNLTFINVPVEVEADVTGIGDKYKRYQTKDGGPES